MNQKFTGGDDLTGFAKYVHEVMMLNELEGGYGAYELRHAKKGDSGYSFGGNQMDLRKNDYARKVFKNILAKAKVEAVEIESYIFKFKNNILLAETEKQKINYILGSKQGKEEINSIYMDEITSKIKHVNSILTSVHENLHNYIDNVFFLLVMVDYHNQLDLTSNGPMHRVLRGEKVSFHRDFALNFNLIKTAVDLVQQIRAAIDCTTWASSIEGANDIARRQKNIDLIVNKFKLSQRNARDSFNNIDNILSKDQKLLEYILSLFMPKINIQEKDIQQKPQPAEHGFHRAGISPYASVTTATAMYGNEYAISIAERFDFVQTPFKKDDLYLQGINCLLFSVFNEPGIHLAHIATTLCYFGNTHNVKIELADLTNQISSGWRQLHENALSIPAWNDFPALKFTVPGKLSCRHLLSPFANVLTTFPGLPNLDLDQIMLDDLSIVISPNNDVYIFLGQHNDMKIVFGIMNSNAGYAIAVSIDHLKLKVGILSKIMSEASFSYATADFPALGISKLPRIFTKFNPRTSSLVPIKTASILFGINFPIQVGVELLKENEFILIANLGKFKIHINFLEISDILFIYSTASEALSLKGQAKLDLWNDQILGESEIDFSSQGAIKGRIHLDDHFEKRVSLFKGNVYLSNLAVLIKKADDQALKAGIEGDFCLKPKKECTEADIGHFEISPGAELINSDIVAVFPKEFSLSPYSTLSQLAGKSIPLTKFLTALEYTGYIENDYYKQLCIKYLPSESRFEVNAAAKIFGLECSNAHILLSKASSIISLTLPIIQISDILKITGRDTTNGAYLYTEFASIDQYSPHPTNPNITADIQANIQLFNILSSNINVKLDDDSFTASLKETLTIGDIIHSRSELNLTVNIQKQIFRLSFQGIAKLNLKINHKVTGPINLGVCSIDIDLLINSESNLIQMNCKFRTMGLGLTFSVNFSLNGIHDEIGKLKNVCEEVLENHLSSLNSENILAFLTQFDPTNNPQIKEAIEKIQNEIDKASEKAKHAGDLRHDLIAGIKSAPEKIGSAEENHLLLAAAARPILPPVVRAAAIIATNPVPIKIHNPMPKKKIKIKIR